MRTFYFVMAGVFLGFSAYWLFQCVGLLLEDFILMDALAWPPTGFAESIVYGLFGLSCLIISLVLLMAAGGAYE